MTEQTIETAPTTSVPAGFLMDGKGRMVPENMVRPIDLLEDQFVQGLIERADAMSSAIAAFKTAIFEDVGAHLDLLAERYGAKRGGVKGNLTFTSFDGNLRVNVQVAEHMTFGSGLQVAKDLIDACITDWSAGANAKIKVLVDHAFRVDKQGQVSREAIFALRRLEIDDERWQSAMTAIADSIRIDGTKSYVRFYRRANADAPWTPISIALASA